MGEFEGNLQILKEQRNAPVTAAKQELAPTRAALEEGKQNFLKLAAKLRPIFEASRAKELQAASAGVRHPEVTRCLREVYGDGFAHGLLRGTPSAYDDAIRQIDGLTALELERYRHRVSELRSAPRNIGACAGALEDLAKRVQLACEELAEGVQRAAGAPAPVTATVAPQARAELVVESSFEPRR
jgi:hypothetical protein